MAEATIGHLIEVVKAENAETRSETKENTKQLISLNKTFSDYFKSLKADDLDQAEKDREAKKKEKDDSNKAGNLAKADDPSTGGFLFIVGAILVAVGGFLTGVVDGILSAFKLALRGVRFIFRPFTNRIIKPIANFFDAISDVFRKSGTGKFLKANTKATLGKLLKPLDTFFDTLKSFGRSAQNVFNNSLAKLKGFKNTIMKPIEIIGRYVTRLKSAFMAIPEIKQFRVDFRSLRMAFNRARAGGETLGRIGTFFRSFGQTLRTIGSALRPIFTIFRTLGRFIFFPLTIIMSIFDGIKGAVAGYQDQGILGGILGAVGGILSGLIGLPLDLLKSAVGFIAGLLGFDNFKEMLAEFSFADSIKSIFNKIAEVFNNAISFVVDSVGAIGRKVANFFGFGGGDEEESTAPEPTPEPTKVKIEPPKETIPEEQPGGMTVAELDEKIKKAEIAQRLHDNRLDLIQMGEKGRGRFARMSEEERDKAFDKSLDRRNDLELELANLRETRFGMTGSYGSSINVQNSQNTALLDDTPSAMDSMDRSYAPA